MGKTEQTEANKKINNWLTPELQVKVKNVFGVRYKKDLSDDEVSEIANNLTSYMEHLVDFVRESHCEKQFMPKELN